MSVEWSKRITAFAGRFRAEIWGSIKIRLGGQQIGCSAANVMFFRRYRETCGVHRIVSHPFVSSCYLTHILFGPINLYRAKSACLQ